MDETTVDVLSVGSGPGGLIAATVARRQGLESLVVEKSRYVGGTSTQSFGALWFADNPRQRDAGRRDSVEDALTYLESIVGDAGPATGRARQEAYLREGLRLLAYLEALGVEFVPVRHYPDYYAERPGGVTEGRILNSPLFDARRLGPWRGWVRPRERLPLGMVVGSIEEFKAMALAATSIKAAGSAARTFARGCLLKARGVRPLVLGAAYIGQLLLVAQREQVPIWRESPMRELLVSGDRVVGAVVERDGRPVTVRARRGVLLNTGGFARNLELREKFGPHPASVSWTSMIPEDTGDGYRVATDLGAATSNLDEAYWLPMLLGPDGEPQLFLTERHQPHSLIVDGSGARYADEAADYMALGKAMYARHRQTPAIPSWLIIDSRHRARYPLGFVMPRVEPKAWLRSGYLRRADSIGALADACGIDRPGLEAQVERFNEMAGRGVDEDFHRGESHYDRVYGDPTVRPNPCLGAVARPPFYAAQVVPGDLGMAGGVVTDEHGAVLREDRTRIPGLYACGTTAASAMGRVYAGGGISLGQSSVFGFLAAEQMCRPVSPAHDPGE